MAQHFTNFGNSPTLTERWNTGNYAATVETSGLPSGAGSHALKLALSTSAARFAVSWDNPGTPSGDVEVVARLQHAHTSDIANTFGLVLHGSGAASSENAYITAQASFATNSVQIAEYPAGGSTVSHDNDFVAIDRNAWYRVRFRREGNDLLARWWADGDSEPGTWLMTATDATLSSGWVGVWSVLTAGTTWCDWIGVGTGGDAAPMEPVPADLGSVAAGGAATSSVARVVAPARLTPAATGAGVATVGLRSPALLTPSATGAGVSAIGLRSPALLSPSATGAGTAAISLSTPALLTAAAASTGVAAIQVSSPAMLTAAATGAGSMTAIVTSIPFLTIAAAGAGSMTAAVISPALLAVTAAGAGVASVPLSAPALMSVTAAGASSAAAALASPWLLAFTAAGSSIAAASLVILVPYVGGTALEPSFGRHDPVLAVRYGQLAPVLELSMGDDARAIAPVTGRTEHAS